MPHDQLDWERGGYDAEPQPVDYDTDAQPRLDGGHLVWGAVLSFAGLALWVLLAYFHS